MRDAATLFKHNRFARLFGVSKCAELLLADAYGERDGLISLRVESETTSLFDDIVELRGEGHEQHGWQIKQQSTDLDAELVRNLLRGLRDQTHLATGNLATSDPIRVASGGHLRVLRDLCLRLSATGVDPAEVVARATPDETKWLEFAAAATESDASAILCRLRVHFLGDERALDIRTQGSLPGLYGPPIRNVINALERFVYGIDGTANVTAELLRKQALLHLGAQSRHYSPAGLRRGQREKYLDAVIRSFEEAPALETIPGAGAAPNALLADVFVPRRLRRTDSEYLGLREWLRIGAGTKRGFVVLGEVGAGKSTLLRETECQIAREAVIDGRAPLPLRVRAQELKDLNPLTAVSRRLGVTDEAVESLVGDPLNNWVLLIDGADEVVGNTWASIDRVTRRVGDTQLASLVVATRPVAQPAHPDYTTLSIEPWDTVAVSELLERWKVKEPESVARLVNAPYFDNLQERLLLNPLMASLCLLLAKENRPVPSERSRVFSEIIELVFEGWRTGRSSQASVEWRSLRVPLGSLALRSLQEGRAVSSGEIRDAIRSSHSGAVLPATEEAQRDLGLLVGLADGTYTFALRSFAEHLAAAYLVDTSQDVVPLARQGWSEEVVRHAVGLIALRSGPEGDNEISRLVADYEGDVDLFAPKLRPFLVAIRSAADLPISSPSGIERLADISACLLLDEDSAWVGARVAAELRVHARSNSALWTACFSRVYPHVATTASASRWQLDHLDGGDIELRRLLKHRDPDVRAMALRGLSKDFFVENPDTVIQCLFDNEHGWGLGLPSPAVMAAFRLRSLPRTDPNLVRFLQQLLRLNSQLLSGAAAVALVPGEADPVLLARALRELASGFAVPPEVIRALEADSDGASALTSEWPDRNPGNQASLWEPHRMEEGVLPTFRPTTAAAADRIVSCLDGALQRLSQEQLLVLLGRRSPARDLVVCRALLDGDFRMLDDSNALLNLSAGAQRLLGRAAVVHPEVRAGLLAAWQSVAAQPIRYAAFPGSSLEALVLAGDNDAIPVYAEWIRHSFGATREFSTPDSRLFEIPEIRTAAENAISDLIQYVTVGRPDPHFHTTRLAIGAAARPLKELLTVWRGDTTIIEILLEHLCRDDSNDYRGALECLNGVPLDDDQRARVKLEILRKIDLQQQRYPGRYAFEAAVGIRWLTRNGFASDAAIVALLTKLAESNSSLNAIATALLLFSLESAEAERRSTLIAEAGISARREDLSDHELSWLVAAAPTAWASLASSVARQVPPNPAIFVRIINALPMSHRAQTVANVFSGAATWPLPWIQDERQPLGRPRDLACKAVFDAGLDLLEVMQTPSGGPP